MCMILLDHNVAMDEAIRTILDVCLTALHLAALKGHAEIIELLPRRGAQVNKTTAWKRNCLALSIEIKKKVTRYDESLTQRRSSD